MEKGHCSIDYEDYIEHHGIEGQRWGIRNGPPYPLGSGKRKFSRREILRGDNQPSYYAKKKARLYAEEYRKNGNRAPGKRFGFGNSKNDSNRSKNEYDYRNKSSKEIKAEADSKDGENKILKKWNSMSKESKVTVVVGLGIVTAAMLGGSYIAMNKDMVKKYPGIAKMYVDDVLPDIDPTGKVVLDSAIEAERAKLPKNFKPVDFDDTDSYLLYKVVSEDVGKESSMWRYVDAYNDVARIIREKNEERHLWDDINGHNHIDDLDGIGDALRDTNPLRFSKADLEAGELTKIQKTYNSSMFTDRTIAKGNKFGTNCPYASWTYELRRRGEDVVASPGSGLYGSIMEVHASKYFDLQPGAVGQYKIDSTTVKSYMCPNRDVQKHYEKTLTQILSPQILEQYGGQDCRGQLLVPGHSMNWEIKDGKVYYSCAQGGFNNSTATAFLNEYLVKIQHMTNKDEPVFDFKTIRLDNAPLKSDAVLDFCTDKYTKDKDGRIAVNVDTLMSSYESQQLSVNINNLIHEIKTADNPSEFIESLPNKNTESSKLFKTLDELWGQDYLLGDYASENYKGKKMDNIRIDADPPKTSESEQQLLTDEDMAELKDLLIEWAKEKAEKDKNKK